MHSEPTVFVVDDNEAVRNSMKWLIQPLGFRVELFDSAEAFLANYHPDRSGCLVLDLRMPEMNGMELQEQLGLLHSQLPIIIVSGHADVPTCVQAFRRGVFGFLEKPANEGELLKCVGEAVAHDANMRAELARRLDVQTRLDGLTDREREVLQLLIAGKEVKHISAQMGVSFQTVAKHRGKLLKKMGVETDTELTRLILSVDAQVSPRSSTSTSHGNAAANRFSASWST